MIDLDKLTDALTALLRERGALYCSRDWSAWTYGTMNEDDFHDFSDDRDAIEEIAAELAINVLKTILIDEGK